MADDKKNIIIVKKVIKKGGGHHGGAWKVAYADFVTAMMALFIVLWVLGQNDDIKRAVSNYFQDPTGYSEFGKNVMIGKNAGVIEMEKDGDMRHKKEEELKKFEEMKDEIMDELGDDENYIPLLDQIKIEVVEDGMRIEMVESSKNIFFQIGSATLNDKSNLLMQMIGSQLSKIPNKIAIEGHTDSRPLNRAGDNYTNFELSTDRANSARRAIVAGGVTEGQIDEIRGYADKRLRDKSNPYSLVNRRISITVKYLIKE